MPKIIHIDEMHMEDSGDGWHVYTVADASLIGYPAMVAKWWILTPHAHSPTLSRGEADELLYVIKGSGQAIVGTETFPLDHESVLWLEVGDSFQLIAGREGIEILQAYAPGELIDDG